MDTVLIFYYITTQNVVAQKKKKTLIVLWDDCIQLGVFVLEISDAVA